MRYLSHSLSTERGEETSSNARVTLDQSEIASNARTTQNSGLAKLMQFLSQEYHHSAKIHTIKVQLNELHNVLRHKQLTQGFEFCSMSFENQCKPLEVRRDLTLDYAQGFMR